MANLNAPKGFIPVGHLDGAPFNGKVNMYLVPSSDGTAIYVGDAVKSGSTAGAAGTFVNGIDCEGMETITVAAAGDTLRGVVVGFLADKDNLMRKHRAASTARIALVADGPDVIYEVQEDSIGNNIAVTQVGNNFDLAYTAGSATTGVSGALLDSSDASGTGSAQFRVIGLVKRPDNALGTYGKWLVFINEHDSKSTTGV